jgi:hypothetical protein
MSELIHKTMATTIRNQKLFCLNCGGSFALAFPIPVNKMTKKIKTFDVLHKDCPVTWKEPKADQTQDEMTKAEWWLANGEHGMSSITMCRTLMGDPMAGRNYPYDPDDFSRCYKLLQAVPEWKGVREMQRLKKISPEWSNLIDNWDELTKMYEENIRTNWKNYEKIGMYELMQKCINPKLSL